MNCEATMERLVSIEGTSIIDHKMLDIHTHTTFCVFVTILKVRESHGSKTKLLKIDKQMKSKADMHG